MESVFTTALVIFLSMQKIEGRVYCVDKHATPWLTKGYSCPVKCENVVSIIEKLKVSDYDAIVSDIMSLITTPKTHVTTLPFDEKIKEKRYAYENGGPTTRMPKQKNALPLKRKDVLPLKRKDVFHPNLLKDTINPFKDTLFEPKKRAQLDSSHPSGSTSPPRPKRTQQPVVEIPTQSMRMAWRPTGTFARRTRRLPNTTTPPERSEDRKISFRAWASGFDLRNGPYRRRRGGDLKLRKPRFPRIHTDMLSDISEEMGAVLQEDAKYRRGPYRRLDLYPFVRPTTRQTTRRIHTDILSSDEEITAGTEEPKTTLRRTLARAALRHDLLDSLAPVGVRLASAHCINIIVPGCFCQTGYVEKQGQCVRPVECITSAVQEKYLHRIIVA